MSKIKVTIETPEGSFTAVSKGHDRYCITADKVVGTFALAMDGLTYSPNYKYQYDHLHPVSNEVETHPCPRAKPTKKTKKAIKREWGDAES